MVRPVVPWGGSLDIATMAVQHPAVNDPDDTIEIKIEAMDSTAPWIDATGGLPASKRDTMC